MKRNKHDKFEQILDNNFPEDFFNAEENNIFEKKAFRNDINHLNFNDIELKLRIPELSPLYAPQIPSLISPTDGSEIGELPKTTRYLESVFARAGYRPDVFGGLRELVEGLPQQIGGGRLREFFGGEGRDLMYLVTSGLSVDLITGYRRPHKDIDLVLMHPEVKGHNVFRTTDNVSCEEFWAGMNLGREFLTRTVFRAYAEETGEVLCAHPAITMVQKTSDAWGRKPREHDIHDATALAYWMLGQPEERQKRDMSIARIALDSLQANQRARTADRLNIMFDNYPAIAAELRGAKQPVADTAPAPDLAFAPVAA